MGVSNSKGDMMKFTNYRIFINIGRLFILIILLLGVETRVLASENIVNSPEQRKVRVGFPHFDYYSTISEDGTYGGLVYDYLIEISKYAGWELEFVEGDPSELFEKLQNGELDIMGAIVKNDETLKQYDFAELNSGYSYSTLVVKENNTQYISKDLDSFDGMRVGVYKNASKRIYSFEQFSETNNLNIIPVYYDNINEWANCLNTNKVDAVLTNNTTLNEDEKIVARFAAEPYFFAVSKGKWELIRELNNSLEKIDQINPDFNSLLYEKYFAKDMQKDLVLTLAEKEFLQTHPILRVAVIPNWEPISYWDQATNSYRGISVDILQLISEMTGLQFEYVQTETLKESLEMLSANEVDLISGIYNTDFLSDYYNVTLSIPYYSSQTIILHKKSKNLDQIDELVLAMPYGMDYRNSYFKNCKVKYYETVDDCILAVKKGLVDFTAISNIVVEQYSYTKNMNDLLLVPVPESIKELSSAFASPVNPQLLSIMDKAIYAIDESEKQSITYHNTSENTSKVTLLSFINANPTQVIFVVIFLSLLIIVTLFLVMRMRLRLSQKISISGEAYRIIGEFAEEYLFEYNFEFNQLKLPETFAKLINRNLIISKNEDGSAGLQTLFSAFESNNLKSNFTIEFKCDVIGEREEWFRAICTILYDSYKRPIQGIGKIISIQTEMEEKQSLIEKAHTDGLTGLSNKTFCEQLVMKYFNNTDTSRNAALILIDFDHFKQVNDSIGHLGGDAALNYLVSTMQDIFDSGEILGRWGGDEFFIFAKDIGNREETVEKVRLLCTTMDTTFQYEDKTQKLSVSAGIAFTSPKWAYKDLFRAADAVLYQVKEDSRNGYQIAN